MEQKAPESELEEQAPPVDGVSGGAAVRAALLRMRSGMTPDRLLAALCIATVLLLAAPWVQIPVAKLADRSAACSVPDVLATSKVVVDRAQSFQDLADDVRQIAARAADVVERAQDVAERVSVLREERG